MFKIIKRSVLWICRKLFMKELGFDIRSSCVKYGLNKVLQMDGIYTTSRLSVQFVNLMQLKKQQQYFI